MFTIKLFDDNAGTIECIGAEGFIYHPAVTDSSLGYIDTLDGREDVVIAKGQRCYVVNEQGKTVFKVTEYGAN